MRFQDGFRAFLFEKVEVRGLTGKIRGRDHRLSTAADTMGI